MASEQLWELKWMILNKHRRWFHSSRVKCPLVKMSASWLLESTYLIWILVSAIILPNNQSRATLWVLETCLSVGLLLWIILITATLSSKMYNMAPLREEFTFEETISISDKSRCLWETCVLHRMFTRFSDTLPCYGLHHDCLTFCFWFEFECITSTTKPLRSSAGIASMRKPASREIFLRFRRTVWRTSLFLAHPAYWNKRVASKLA